MTKQELYKIDDELCQKVKQLKKEQEQYASGVEKGIDMAIRAVRDFLDTEANHDHH